ncbi:hypothetical protein DICPUDRAFT_41097, partial [Dictyostelium purpureum]
NLPPDYIRNIKNPPNSVIPEIIIPTSAIPYYPVLISGRNFGTDPKKIIIYIGGILCDNISFFTNHNSIQDSNEYYKDNYFDSNGQNGEVSMELYQTMDYLTNLVQSSMENNFQILKCDLKLINISSTYLNAQDIYIVANGVLGVEHNKFLFNDISNCNGINDNCFNDGQCYLGTCICKEIEDVGPQCSLKRADYIAPLELDPYYPYITYSNGNTSWSIEFTDLMLLMNGFEPQRGKSKVKKNNTKINNNSNNNSNNLIASYVYNNENYDQRYILNHKDVRIIISIIKNKNETNDLQFDHQNNKKIFYISGDLRLLITIDRLAPYLQMNYTFKLVFNIITNLKERNQCQSRGVSEFEYGRGYSRDDIRWVYIRYDYDILYSRIYGKCIADQLPQSCIIDLDENPFEQEMGSGKFFVFIEPFKNNVTLKPDFSILKYISNYNDYLNCDEHQPQDKPSHWLIPAIVPISVIGISSLILIILNLLKVNRTSLKLNEIYFENNINNNNNDSFQKFSQQNNSNNNFNNNNIDNNINKDNIKYSLENNIEETFIKENNISNDTSGNKEYTNNFKKRKI